MTAPTPDSAHDGLEQLLAQAGAATGAAEGHGLLCGLLCARADDAYARWLEQLSGEIPLSGGADERFRAFALEAGRQLEDEVFGFRLLLPQDAEPLSRRAAALGEWCHGFISALGLAMGADALPEAVTEVVEDLSEIIQISIAPEDCTEEDEGAYAELVEYVRVAVLLVNEELRPSADQPLLH